MPYIILEISIQLRDLLVITKFTNYSLLIGYCPAALPHCPVHPLPWKFIYKQASFTSTSCHFLFSSLPPFLPSSLTPQTQSPPINSFLNSTPHHQPWVPTINQLPPSSTRSSPSTPPLMAAPLPTRRSSRGLARMAPSYSRTST